MDDPYKRSKNGQFAKVAADNARLAGENFQSLLSAPADLTTKAANAETVRKSIAPLFVKVATTALAEGKSLGNSTVAGAKSTPALALGAIGSIAGKNIGGTRGEAVGKVLGSALGGALGGGVPGAIASGAATAIGLDSKLKSALVPNVGRSNAKKNDHSSIQKSPTSPEIAAIESQIDDILAKTQAQSKILTKEIDKLDRKLQKTGTKDGVDLTVRTGASFAANGAIVEGIASGGNLAKIASGAAKGLPGAGIALGVAGGGALGKKIAGTDGETIGRVLGGSLAAGVAATIATGGVGVLPAMAVGAATGLATSNPKDVAALAGKIERSGESMAKEIGRAAQKLTTATQAA